MFDIFSKLLIIDGSFAAFRSYFGYDVTKFRTKDDLANNVVYGNAILVRKLIETIKPTHIAFAYDLAGDNYRKEILPTYKEGRNKTPDELIAQLPVVKEMLKHSNIDYLEKPGLEADDIIATLAHQANNNGWETVIFSSDKDMHQLITPKTKLIKPGFKGAFSLFGLDELQSKYELTPQQYSDFAALVGEGADNIPGVPSVGPKTATIWLKKYGSLDEIIKNADEIEGKVGEKLRENKDIALRNKKLNTLIKDAKLDKNVDDLFLKEPNLTALDEFFERWNMPSLKGKFIWN